MWATLIVIVVLAINIDAAPKLNYRPLSPYNKRSLDGLGGGNLIGRSLDGIGGGHLIGRNLQHLPKYYPYVLYQRTMDEIGGDDLIGRSLLKFARTMDEIGGDTLIGRSLDGIGGDNLIGRSLDGIGGGNLIGRNLDGIGGGNLNDNEDLGMMLIERKPLRNFDILKIGGGFGLAKRYENSEKHRRGPLNGLIPGGAFGRTSRSNNQRFNQFPSNYDKITKFLYGQFDDVLEENRNNIVDGQQSSSIERNSQESSNQFNNIDGE